MENGRHHDQELRLQVPGTNDRNYVYGDDSVFDVMPGSDLLIEGPEEWEDLIAELSTPTEVLIQEPPSMVPGETSVIAAINQVNPDASTDQFPLFSTGKRVPSLRFARPKPAEKYSCASSSGGITKNFGAGRNSKATARKSLSKEVIASEVYHEIVETSTCRGSRKGCEGYDEDDYGGCDKKNIEKTHRYFSNAFIC